MVCLQRLKLCAAPALGLALAGCSVHPLPENSPLNFPRASTYDIVNRVRCEAKAGLDRAKRGRSAKAREHIDKIVEATSIGYDFEFNMFEDNNLSSGVIDFRRPGNAPTTGVSAGLSGSATRHRENKRNIRIIETLGEVANIEAAACPADARSNLALPLSGSLQVDEVVRTYIRLERISDLEQPEEEPIEGPVGQTRAGVFSETLVFKTKLSGGAKPTLTLNAVVGRFRVTNATVHGTAERRDEHSLIIAFAQTPKFDDEKYNRKVDKARKQRRKWIEKGNKVVRGASTEAAITQAAVEFAQNRVALELSRQRNLLDDRRDSVRYLGEQLLRALRPPDETGPGDY